MKAQKRQTPKSENAMDIKLLTVIFQRGGIVQFEIIEQEIERLKDSLKSIKNPKYLYCWTEKPYSG